MQWGYNAPAEPQRYSTLPQGTYDAELVSCEEKTSKQGNSMIEMTLRVYGQDREHQVRDWLVNTDGMAWKTKAFVEAVGQTYGLPIDFEKAKGKLFQVKIKEEPYTNRDGETKIQNKVDDYYPAAKNSVRPATISEAGSEIPDSDLPF